MMQLVTYFLAISNTNEYEITNGRLVVENFSTVKIKMCFSELAN